MNFNFMWNLITLILVSLKNYSDSNIRWIPAAAWQASVQGHACPGHLPAVVPKFPLLDLTNLQTFQVFQED